MNNLTLNTNLLELFKGLYGVDSIEAGISTKALRYGILMPNVDDSLVDDAIDLYGRDGFSLNSTFHKSFSTVKDIDPIVHYAQQIVHYITGYGVNLTDDYVYIPTEKLDIPTLDVEKIKLIVIKNMTKDEIFNKIKTLCTTALNTKTAQNVATVLNEFHVSSEFVEEIVNKEVKCICYSTMGIVPKDPNELLRYLIYLKTRSTLVINNDETIKAIRDSWHISVDDVIKKYIDNGGFYDLVHIFKAKKDLLLAFKTKETASIFNAVNKASKKLPKKKNILKSNESILNTNYHFAGNSLIDTIRGFETRKIIALINRLRYLQGDNDYIEYKIRNGKSFVKENKNYYTDDLEEFAQREDVLFEVLKERIKNNIKDKTFYVPQAIDYTIPTTEKDFIGMIPNKTEYALRLDEDKAFVVAIQWDEDVDLDFSYIDESGHKIGWNGSFRNENGKVLFSGDMVGLDENGHACEALYFEDYDTFGNLKVNVYSFRDFYNGKVPFKFIVAQVDKINGDKLNYVIDPNDIVFTANMEVDREISLGSLSISGNFLDMTFDNAVTSNRNISTMSDVDKMRLDVLKHDTDRLRLRELIRLFGGKYVKSADEADYDLSPEALTKETFFKLLLDKRDEK